MPVSSLLPPQSAFSTEALASQLHQVTDSFFLVSQTARMRSPPQVLSALSPSSSVTGRSPMDTSPPPPPSASSSTHPQRSATARRQADSPFQEERTPRGTCSCKAIPLSQALPPPTSPSRRSLQATSSRQPPGAPSSPLSPALTTPPPHS